MAIEVTTSLASLNSYFTGAPDLSDAMDGAELGQGLPSFQQFAAYADQIEASESQRVTHEIEDCASECQHCLSPSLSEEICQMIRSVNSSLCDERWKAAMVEEIRSLYLLPSKQAFYTVHRLEECFSRVHLDDDSPQMIELNALKKVLKKAVEEEVGQGMVYRNGSEMPPVSCVIKQTMTYSDTVDEPVTDFHAYIPGQAGKVGRCIVRVNKFTECKGVGYGTNLAVGVLKLDSYANTVFHGIGTLLMQAAMEYGLQYGCRGRIALHSESSALGFYYKIGMRTMSKRVDAIIKRSVDRTVSGTGTRVGIPLEDPEFMYLPQEAVERWQERIQRNPVLYL